MTLDGFDIALLRALQRDGAMTNAALSETVNLSASQCSRRRAALEAAGLIAGYAARLNAEKLGFGFRAMVRVNLRRHGGDSEAGFASFIARSPEVRAAFSVSGDADYILDLRTARSGKLRDLHPRASTAARVGRSGPLGNRAQDAQG